MTDSGDSGSAVTRAFFRLFVVLASYAVAWRFAGLLDVHPDVSALYVPAGLTVTFAALFGWRYLAVIWAAIVVARMQTVPFTGADSIDFLGALRQTLIYGAAGLYLRKNALRADFRWSLGQARRFVGIAFVASLSSAAITLRIPPFDTIPPERVDAVFFSFWGGDFAGVMLTVPTVLIARQLWQAYFEQGDEFVLKREELGAKARSVALVLALAVTLSGFVAWLPVLMSSSMRLGVLVLIPVLLAGLRHGVVTGFAVAITSGCALLLAGAYEGVDARSVLDLQLFLVMASAIALIAGGAHDDMKHEWKRANFDALTGLPNRHMLQDRLDHELRKARRSGEGLAVLYLDLDGFKEVNDTHGHGLGDGLLREVARRLKASVRDSDTVGRLAGDEFLVILPAQHEQSAVEAVTRKILKSLNQPLAVDSQSVRISTSIGVAFWPDDGASAPELIARADHAMYAAKAQGRNRYALAKSSPSGA